MIYTEFLTLMKENTIDNLDEYRELCRICLANQPNGFDIADDNIDCESKREQRDTILNNYIIVMKQSVSVIDLLERASNTRKINHT